MSFEAETTALFELMWSARLGLSTTRDNQQLRSPDQEGPEIKLEHDIH